MNAFDLLRTAFGGNLRSDKCGVLIEKKRKKKSKGSESKFGLIFSLVNYKIKMSGRSEKKSGKVKL